MRILSIRDYDSLDRHEIPLPLNLSFETLDDTKFKVEKIKISMEDFCIALNYLMEVKVIDSKFMPGKRKIHPYTIKMDEIK